MDYFRKDFLQQHAKNILAFYNDRVIDASGGYYQNFYDDGSLFDESFKQLVSSCRIVVNYALSSIEFEQPDFLDVARHGLDYIEQVHWQSDTETYSWTIRDGQPEDMTQQAYGYAFLLLTYASSLKAGLISSDDKLEHIYNLLEQRFWQPEFGLYADEISSDGILDEYRGQNANMHMCEAMLAAFEATEQQKYLERALTIAQNITVRQADLTNGLVWEHYTPEFQPDWEYNKEDPKNLYRPWGFQPGHQTEWTKLLLMLNRHKPQAWLVEKAQFLFDEAFKKSWDSEHGGLIYGFSPEGKWCDDDKYFWVQAESFAAAALLYAATEDGKYLTCYQQLWQYSWDHMVDHQYGAWFRVLHRDNHKYSNEKSAAGAKCDYHSLCACLEVLRVLNGNN